METTIYSIGHGVKGIDEFTSELLSFNIQFLIDVRSNPFSKWVPQYNREELSHYLSTIGIKYLYMGDTIGGRPSNDDCYDDEGYFSYEKMANIPAFQNGIKRLVVANNKQIKVAVMCSESKPEECHRSKLIGRELYDKYNINMLHIIESNKVITESQIISYLSDWSPEGDLFGKAPLPFFRSRKAYRNVSLFNEPYYE